MATPVEQRDGLLSTQIHNHGHAPEPTQKPANSTSNVEEASSDDTLRLWDLQSGESRVLTGHTGGIRALAVLPDGRALSGSYDRSVIVWDVPRGAPIAAFVGDAAITCIAATPIHIIAQRTAPSTCCGFAGNPFARISAALSCGGGLLP